MSAVSSTFEAHQSVQSEERHFALVDAFAVGVAFALPTKARLVISFRSGTQSDPCVSSVTTSIMITTSNSPVKGSGIPNQLLVTCRRFFRKALMGKGNLNRAIVHQISLRADCRHFYIVRTTNLAPESTQSIR
jgi:hypothetical protein